MAEYDLFRLSNRSFEQLVQALAVSVIGPGVKPFGDGPDGGRDAVFEGKFPYPSHLDGWDGYGVIQAKFLQQSRNARHDGDWVISQLRDELNEYCKPETNRRLPEYFILATNVSLTAVQGTGSKDRVLALLRDYEERLSLKGYDIWDYDQIRAFLDNNEEIRIGYAAWITPGDVLSAIIERLRLETPDLEQILSRFLQSEMLSDEYVRLEQAGRNSEERIPLANVFIDLPARNDPLSEMPEDIEDTYRRLSNEATADTEEEGFISEVLRFAEVHLDSKSLFTNSSPYSSETSSSVQRNGRLVLIGGPGSGKTTIGQFICQIFRASIIERRPEYSLPEEIRGALAIFRENWKSMGIDLPIVPRFPFKLQLNELAAALASDDLPHVNSVFSFLAHRIYKSIDHKVSADDLRKCFAKYPSIVIFDGLDEVSSSVARELVLKSIREFWIDVSNLNADVLSIATSRPQGYGKEFSTAYYMHRRLVPIPKDLGMHFAERLVEVRYRGDRDRKATLLGRLARALESESTGQLMRSPLQITIMTFLLDRMGQLPEGRWSLFESYYRAIYEREIEKDIPASDLLRGYKSNIDAIHNQVGLLLQIDIEGSSGAEAKLTKQRFVSLVRVRLEKEGYDGETLEHLTGGIVNAALQRLVFLVGLEADQIGFEIRPLQEFKAAECLMEGTEYSIHARLHEIGPIPHWRNVFLLAAGQCFAKREYLRDTVVSICLSLNDSVGDEILGDSWAGSDLAIDLLDEGLVRRQPLYEKVLARLALQGLDSPSLNFHQSLTRIYEPELEQVYLEELLRRLKDTRQEFQLGAWNCLLYLAAENVDWALELAEESWPENAETQLAIFRQNLSFRKNRWVFGKFLELAPKVPPRELMRPLAVGSIGSYYTETESKDLNDEHESLVKVLESNTSWSKTQVKFLQHTLSNPLFVSAFGTETSWLLHFRNLTDCHPAWGVYRAAANFLAAPSKENLAAQLKEIASSGTAKQDIEMLGPAPMIPWVLLACLRVCSDKADLLQMADSASSGELGDTIDWLAAENRWAAGGVAEEDITSMTDIALPYDRHIGALGFPTTLPPPTGRNSDETASAALAVLTKLHCRLPESESRSYIATVLTNCLLNLEHLESRGETVISDTLGIECLRSVCNDLPAGAYFPLSIVINRFGGFGQETVDLFSELQRLPIKFAVYDSPKNLYRPDAIDQFITTYEGVSDSNALLVPLGLMAEHGQLDVQALSVPNPDILEDKEQRTAAFIIKLTQNSWDVDDVHSHISFIQEIGQSSDDIYIRIINAMRENPPDGPFADKFLSEFGKAIPSSRYALRRYHANLLAVALWSRTSRFSDPIQCEQYELPDSLVTVLQRQN